MTTLCRRRAADLWVFWAPSRAVGRDGAQRLQGSGVLHLRGPCRLDWGAQATRGALGWAGGLCLLSTSSELFAIRNIQSFAFQHCSFIHKPAFQGLVNAISHFAGSRPVGLVTFPHWRLHFEVRLIDIWANSFMRHLESVPVSGLRNLKAPEGLHARGEGGSKAQHPVSVFQASPWGGQSWSLGLMLPPSTSSREKDTHTVGEGVGQGNERLILSDFGSSLPSGAGAGFPVPGKPCWPWEPESPG